MTRVLIADHDVDSHELIDDLIEINFQDAVIERALTKESFFIKIDTSGSTYNLILFNLDLEHPGEKDIFVQLEERHPELISRIVFLSSGQPSTPASAAGRYAILTKPFSLDHFGEVVKKTCAF